MRSIPGTITAYGADKYIPLTPAHDGPAEDVAYPTRTLSVPALAFDRAVTILLRDEAFALVDGSVAEGWVQLQDQASRGVVNLAIDR